jgi:alpha-galactosidase/6-phospho-beta-glucosidase family protein
MTKIAIIGAGSYSWGPTFLRDIFVSPALKGSTVCLHDIDAGRLDLNFRLAQKMLADFKLDFQVEQTLSLDEALTGADFILLTITTGGLETMRPDLEIPWKYGLRQSVGDTVGPGGISRALRNIPVVADMARRVEAFCPQAWFLNYTNPLSTLTRAIDMQRSVRNRTVGLCHEWIGVRAKLAAILGVEPEQVTGPVAGINHFIWVTDLYAAGRRVWGELPGIAGRILSGEIDTDPDEVTPFVDKARVKARLFQLYEALPAAGDRHIAEFLPSFLCAETNWGADFGVKLTSADDRAAIMDFERTWIESALAGEIPLEPFMQELSGEAASPILTAIVGGGRYEGILNLPNQGQVSNLPSGAVVETYGSLDSGGAHAFSFGELPPGVQNLVERHARNQELTVQAALRGDRSLALQAMLNDPLTGRLPVDQTGRMLDELLEANKAYLPQFA